jgi:hypothetical protein
MYTHIQPVLLTIKHPFGIREPMKAQYIAAKRLNSSDDWRASYHLSPAALLSEMGEHWPSLQQTGSECIDGWRASLKPVAGYSERDIEDIPLYRLRHIENSILETEGQHAQPRAIQSKPFCIRPWDVVIKKVGGIKAALTLPEHGVKAQVPLAEPPYIMEKGL